MRLAFRPSPVVAGGSGTPVQTGIPKSTRGESFKAIRAYLPGLRRGRHQGGWPGHPLVGVCGKTGDGPEPRCSTWLEGVA